MEGEDKISQLPEDILISIITRVPTKEAVRTSVLSKNWRNIYKFVSAFTMACRCNGPAEDCDYYEVAYKLYRLSKQLDSGSIRSFKFCCCLPQSYAPVLEEFIRSLGKGIEKLVLQFSVGFGIHPMWREFIFPCDILSHMPSLKYFNLRHCSLEPNLHTHCNSLKTLRLSKVKVAPGSLECILSNCLSLSTLLIRNCILPRKICFRGPNLQLKSVMMYDCDDVEEICLYASNLITLEFSSREMFDLIFEYVPQLQNILLSSYLNYFWRLGKVLPLLKSLHMDIKKPGKNIYLYSGMPYMFNNLERLEVSATCAGDTNLLSLTPLLHSCPLLQEFHLAISNTDCCGPQVEKSVVVHRELKKVDISGFDGKENQIEFVSYILKCAVALQQIHISWLYNEYNGYGEWEEGLVSRNREMLYQCVKQLEAEAASPTVQVMFQESPRIKSKQFTQQDGIFADDLALHVPRIPRAKNTFDSSRWDVDGILADDLS